MHHLIPLIQPGGVVASGIGLFNGGLRCKVARERSNAWRAAHARGRDVTQHGSRADGSGSRGHGNKTEWEPQTETQL